MRYGHCAFPSPRCLRRWVWLPIALLCVGCAARSTTTYSDYDETGRSQPSTRVQATVVGKERGRIDSALALARTGDYAAGIAILEEMRRDPDLGDSWRQEVLIHLGEMHGMPLNPLRNREKAVACLEELLQRYPEGEYAERARELLETYDVQGHD